VSNVIPVQTGEPAVEVEDGEHPATIVNLVYINEFPDGSTPKGGAMLEWWFELRLPDGGKTEVKGTSSLKWVPGSKPSKLYKWCNRLGVDASDGLDVDKLVGRKVRVIVIHDAGDWPRVNDVLAAKK
jgi:hypothetical protein